jgi:hypothetical protein
MPYGNTPPRAPTTRWLSALACSKVSLAIGASATIGGEHHGGDKVSVQAIDLPRNRGHHGIGAASPHPIAWLVRGRPREYVAVELDGKRRTTTLSALANDILDRVLPPFEVSIKEVKKLGPSRKMRPSSDDRTP